MNVNDVRSQLEEIHREAEVYRDDKRAHDLEDVLHQMVLEAIASGTAMQPRELAATALRSRDINFARWCA